MHIIDRRLNPGGKSLANRQRFLKRARALVRQAVRDSSVQRDIKELDQGGEVSIPSDGLREPSLRHAPGKGVRDHLLPGNKDYVAGDTIPRPSGQGGRGSQGSPTGEGEDAFRFALSAQEYIDLFLEDLELPDLVKRRFKDNESWTCRRAGYSVSGSPANLALARTMRNSLSRRMALKRPKPQDVLRLRDAIAALEEEDGDGDRLAALRHELALTLRRSRIIPYIDPLDVRYKRFEPTPVPVAQAVMFCLMDVSGSMTEHMKDLAKRFFFLLHIFLKRRYRRVEIVFIRHTHLAQEVDENTFFHSADTGGTVVSTALEEMIRVVRGRYPPSDWNIYVAQASDGDNTASDNARTASLLSDEVLPLCQYYAYVEVGAGDSASGPAVRESDLWRTYRLLPKSDAVFAMRKVRHRREIYPVFRELFRRGAERTEEVGRP
jgi:uncharacterized sporulation protein YeaH/YhbH (DUF444 family)